ncbi:MAG: hypothetical protein RQ761_10095 [Bacteroidales bacterium]|nr:hypothetical protein [Bacteroidales bacterium]
MMKKLMHFLFLSCLKATELIEKKLYFKLSFNEKMQLKMHKTMCSACSNYEKQSYFLDKVLHSPDGMHDSLIDLADLKKETIIKIKKSEKD